MADTPPRRASNQGPGPEPVLSPPRPPTIPRSSSVSASINFFESKSSPPQPIPVSVPVPRKGSTSGSGSPKPIGPRNMTPPTKEGRRLSYTIRPGVEGRMLSDDPRRGLGMGAVPGQGGRRVSEGGIGLMGVAGPSRVRPMTAGTEDTGSSSRSASHHGRSRTSPATTPPGSREPSATRRPVLRPRQPSDNHNSRPTIRVVHPTPRSQQPYRRTSAPPESPVTPTRTRAFSPVLSNSRASSSSSISNQNQSSSSRSIKPGTRRTSYQLGKPTSSNEGSTSSAISEFGAIGENGETPYLSNFVERFEQGSNEVRQPSPLASPVLPQHAGLPSINRSPWTSQDSTSNLSSPTRPNGKGASDSSSIKTNSTSSFVSARAPSSPPNIPRRMSSNPVSPRIGRRTSSIEGISANSTPVLPSKGHIPTLGPIARTASRDSQDSIRTLDSDGVPRRVSDTTAMAPSRRTSVAGPTKSTNTGTHLQQTIPTPNKSTTPHTSPRPDRKSPGLTINPLAPPRPARDSARPSPPVPVKSPLRRITPQPSTLSEFSSEGHHQKVRDGSGESTAATSDSFLTAPLPSPSPSPSISGSLVLEPGEDIPFPASYDSHGADEIRFTMLTVPSVYSQDSAPSTGRSIVTATTDNESLRSARSGSYGWGRQRHSVISLEGYGHDDFRVCPLPQSNGIELMSSGRLYHAFALRLPILQRHFPKHHLQLLIPLFRPLLDLDMEIKVIHLYHPSDHPPCRS